MTNLKLILRTYSALRQMSPDDIALLETLRGLNDGDRELMVETLQGKATGKKAGKKSSKKQVVPLADQRCVYKLADSSKCGKAFGDSVHTGYPNSGHPFTEQSSSKSSRASGMAAQLKERRSQQRRISTEDVDAAFCAAPNCGEGLTNPIHDPNGGYGSYHPFQLSTTASPAPASSPANGGVGSTIANLEASAASAGAATGGSSE